MLLERHCLRPEKKKIRIKSAKEMSLIKNEVGVRSLKRQNERANPLLVTCYVKTNV